MSKLWSHAEKFEFSPLSGHRIEGYFFSLAFDHLNGLLYGLTSGGYVVACGRTPTRGMNNSSGWTCIKILNGSTEDTYESPIYFSIALRPSNGYLNERYHLTVHPVTS